LSVHESSLGAAKKGFEMNRLMHLGLLAATAILVTTVPSLAQTRDDTDRPQIERPDTRTSSSKQGDRDDHRLPQSTDGLRCLIKEGHAGQSVVVVNGTGAAIPAGTVVVVYLQPGSIEKHFTLSQEWKPGQSLAVPVKLAELPEGAECSVKLKPAQQPADDPVPAEEPEPVDEEPEPADNEDWVPPVGSVPVSSPFSCKVYDHQYAWEPTPSVLFFVNTSGDTLPPDTTIIVTMPDGSTQTVVLGVPYPPGGEFAIELPIGSSLEGYECTFEVVLP
jgi:hypothetical protein